MTIFNASALRGATNATRLSAANDLVQRTLAQHGLTSPLPSMPALEGVLVAPDATQAALPVGATFDHDTFTCKSGSRSLRTYVPASADKGIRGVIVMLHGCTQNPDDFAKGTGMNALAEQHRFVVIYPAQSRGNNAQSCWNWFSRGDQKRGKGEPAIIAGMTQKTCAQFGISRDRTFVAGLSAGAAMAVILGEAYPDVFAAIGAHSGLPYGAAKDVTSAFAAMGTGATGIPTHQTGATLRTIVFHGTADTTVNPANGDSIARHALHAGARQTIETSEQGKTEGRTFTRRQSSNPDGVTILEQWAIDGLGHAWSGGQSGGSYADPKGPNASAQMVRFFFDTPYKAL